MIIRIFLQFVLLFVTILVGTTTTLGKAAGTVGDAAVQTAKHADDAVDAGKQAAKSEKGNYSNLDDSPFVGQGKPFTSTQKKKILNENQQRNNGIIRDDQTGEELVKSMKSKKGVTPPKNEAQIDHIIPKNHGGSNSFDNAQVLSRLNNRLKSDRLPGN